MEGIGYWVFLLILYGLSALMKKRQQSNARQEMEEQEGPEPKSMFASKDEIFKELFGGDWLEESNEKEGEEQPLESVSEEFQPEHEVAHEHYQRMEQEDPIPFDSHLSGIPEQEKNFDEVTDQLGSFHSGFEPTIDSLVVPGKEEDISDHVTKTTARKSANTHLVHMLRDTDGLKYSFMIREVLDKPRALRRQIR